ncbi:Chitosanase precursor [Streptomyces sp. ADI96-15]|nr:Chitosanase precursor [Streptomyces sp. ADI96-15]
MAAITEEPSHTDTSRIDTARRVFLREGNPRLDPPLVWKAYGDTYRIGESACGGGGGGG